MEVIHSHRNVRHRVENVGVGVGITRSTVSTTIAMSCADEAGHGDHSHGNGGGGGGHTHGPGCDHAHDVPLESGPSDSLYTVIDTEHVVALNAAGGGEKGRVVIKWVHPHGGANGREWALREDETTVRSCRGMAS